MSVRSVVKTLALALAGLGVSAVVASASYCPYGPSETRGYTLHFENGEAFHVDKVVDDIAFVRHVDNRGNTLNAMELYKGLFTLATFGGKGRTIYTYDTDPAYFFPLSSSGTEFVGGEMIPENGRPSRVERSWTITGGQSKWVHSGPDREWACWYNVREIEAVTVWPDLGLEFRQTKLWSRQLDMVLYLKTTVIQHGRETRVREYNTYWLELDKKKNCFGCRDMGAP